MENTDQDIRWYYRPWPLIFLLFLVLGPFGLPLVYKSPKFNKLAKILLTLIMIPYTWYLVVLTVDQTQEALRRIQELQSAVG